MGAIVILNLGVIDKPYAENAADPHLVEMTSEVATKLERNYGIMQFFYNEHEQFIANALEESFADALQNALLGGPRAQDGAIFNQACANIETRFKQFLSNQEMDRKIGGVPTEASLLGISSRFKDRRNKKKKRGPRPSFIDTGLYQSSFKAWVEA